MLLSVKLIRGGKVAEILALIVVWIKDHIGMIFTGVAGSIIGALLLDGTMKQKFISLVVGFIMSQCLGEPASKLFYNGEFVGAFSFCIGISGMTLAKILMIYIEKLANSKAGLNNDYKEGK